MGCTHEPTSTAQLSEDIRIVIQIIDQEAQRLQNHSHSSHKTLLAYLQQTQAIKALRLHYSKYSARILADVGASHLNHKLATIYLFQQNESAMVHKGLAFLSNKEINGHLETTFVELAVRTQGWRKTQTPNSEVRPTYLHVKQSTCLTGQLPASMTTSHGGGQGSSLRRGIWTICRAGSSLLILVKGADRPQNPTATFIASTSLTAF